MTQTAISQTVTESQKRIDAELCAVVAQKLGIASTRILFRRHDPFTPKITVPVFAVPYEKMPLAVNLGLNVVVVGPMPTKPGGVN